MELLSISENHLRSWKGNGYTGTFFISSTGLEIQLVPLLEATWVKTGKICGWLEIWISLFARKQQIHPVLEHFLKQWPLYTWCCSSKLNICPSLLGPREKQSWQTATLTGGQKDPIISVASSWTEMTAREQNSALRPDCPFKLYSNVLNRLTMLEKKWESTLLLTFL